MKIILSFFLFLVSLTTFAQEDHFEPGSFNEVTIGPHIQVEFKAGDKESVQILESSEPLSKFNVDLRNNKLQLYLDDAKITTKNKRTNDDDWTNYTSIYDGLVAKVVVTYRSLDFCDLRGSESFLFSSPINQDEFKLAIYGESEVTMNQVNVNRLKATIYGTSHLSILDGKINRERFVAYGESEITSLKVPAQEVKITSYGSGRYYVNAIDQLKVTSFGESEIFYLGKPQIDQQITLGENRIRPFNE